MKTKTKFVTHLNKLLKGNFAPEEVTRTVNIIQKFTSSFNYDENTKEVIVSVINKLLSTAPHRKEGFKLINLLFFQFSNELVGKNSIFWISYIFNKESVTLLKIQILTKIIATCSGTQDFDKYLHNLLWRIIDTCLVEYEDEALTDSALLCLKVCIQKYPGPFVHAKSKIERHLCKYLTSNQPVAVIKRVGSLFQSLQEVGGGGTSQKVNWSTLLYKLCSTLHKVYDDFLTDTPEFATYNEITVPPFDYEITNEEIPTILRNLTVLINCMVVEKFSHPKTVLLPVILDVVKRGLIVDVYELRKQSQLPMLLYTHQTDLLYLLRSLIACFKKDWIPFCSMVTKLIMDCHQRTQKEFFLKKCRYQEALYKVLSYWIYIVNHQLHPSVHQKILSLILSVLKTKRKNEARKLRIRSKPALTVSEKICVGALATCRILVESVNLHLDKASYDLLFQTVTHNIVAIQSGSISQPFTHIRCVIGLYKVLSSIFTQTRYCRSPFIDVAINILTKGQNVYINNNSEISIIRSNILEKMCQPLFPPLSIPQEVDQFNDEQRENTIITNHIDENLISDSENKTDPHEPTETIVVLDDTVMEISDNESSSEIKDVKPPISNCAKEKVKILSVHILNNTDSMNHINDIRNGNNLDFEDEILEVSEEEQDESDVINKMETEDHHDGNVKDQLQDDVTQPIPKQLEVEEMSEEEELLLNSFNNIVNSY